MGSTLAGVSLHLHDTATRTTAPFTPVREGAVSLYVCGPTTQGAPHLGHLRTFLSFDVLVRWLIDAPSLDPGTGMPPMPLTQAQARDVAAYLYELDDD